jgi:hypothetical protein|tara:strand:- start:1955 stop:2254 length:300 start_codon:yes stop_codon:yes gene_type:complete
MLPKTLNTAKLKVKYVLGNHTTLHSYPDAEDVIFELIRDYCAKVAKEIKFTDISMAKRWSLTKEQCNIILTTLLKHKIVNISLQNSAYTTYEVIYNPYE